MTEKLSMSFKDAEAMWEARLETARQELGRLERSKTSAQIEVDKWVESVNQLKKECDELRKTYEKLQDKVANGQAELEDHRRKILKALDEREKQADAQVESAQQSALEASAKHHAAAQQTGRAVAFKTDALKAFHRAHDALGVLLAKAEQELSDIRE